MRKSNRLRSCAWGIVQISSSSTRSKTVIDPSLEPETMYLLSFVIATVFTGSKICQDTEFIFFYFTFMGVYNSIQLFKSC